MNSARETERRSEYGRMPSAGERIAQWLWPLSAVVVVVVGMVLGYAFFS
ncbi:hypothetical protein KGD83_08690 [Nocardiopsis akebiae]|uniref:Uncharacterized protein n=1 Tax=Nocardiopsis akebiae TaxID=2831968 RepID=A0ABX8C939_9ACTN|nr:hypothetical protein [Nocardiopsis akebiae]QUX30567.1 hypothetical protein KGD83_08690 [Nocardiopsis akebiae]